MVHNDDVYKFTEPRLSKYTPVKLELFDRVSHSILVLESLRFGMSLTNLSQVAQAW